MWNVPTTDHTEIEYILFYMLKYLLENNTETTDIQGDERIFFDYFFFRRLLIGYLVNPLYSQVELPHLEYVKEVKWQQQWLYIFLIR